MTTTRTEPRRSETRLVTAPEPRGSSRLADWRSSWRIALRMARRELRRHKGRSVVVALMVALPLVVIAYLATTGQGALTSGQPTATRLMGTAVAAVAEPSTAQLLQDGSHEYYTPLRRQGGDDPNELVPAEPIPGYDPERSAAENSAAISALTGGAATPVAEQTIRVRLGERSVSMQTLSIDGTIDLGDKARLLSGRWPSGPDEVLVTDPGIRKGLPRTGTVDIVTPDGTTVVTVTGTATGLTGWGMIPHLISSEPLPTPSADDRPVVRWLITDTAMPYAKVTELGRFGLHVQSAELMVDPVPDELLPVELRQMSYSESSLLFFWVTGAIILALVIALLVAPAFAVSAARHLAQALVLGVLSAAVGVAVGIALATGQAWWRARTSTEIYLPLVDVPWLALAALALCAVVAAVAAALVPARRLGRLDIMGVIKGQNVSPPPSRIIPLVGGVVMVASGAGLLLGARQQSGGDFVVAIAAIGLVVGALSLVPVTLVAAGRAGSILPVALRMAARDAARQRSRSAPSVAAVLGGVAALTIALVAATSDATESEATYLPQTVMGQGILRVWDTADLEPARAVVRAAIPDSSLVPIPMVGSPFWDGGAAEVPFVTLTGPGCAAPATVEVEAACPAIGGPFGWSGVVIAMPADVIASRLELSAEQAALVREGAAVVRSGDVLGGESAVAYSGTHRTEEMTGMPTDVVTTGEHIVPLIVLPDTAQSRARLLGDQGGVLVALEVAEERGWPLDGNTYLVDGAEDGVSETEAERVRERLENADFYVERGYVDTVGRFLLILVAGVSFILLVVTLTSTALSMSEQRRDDATLAAVGATRRTRRAMAASQALITAGIGAILGLAVGIVPGIAFAYPLTRSAGSDGQPVGPFIAIPYAWLAVVVLGVPLVAALLSAAAVRRAPVITHRLD
ncbi:MAG: hypothetical protein LC679_03395 [Intrasporangiaceae bacterium]|nr:hypothetical protein [Intrasporangiaceae bacterium]